jgi:hypothetical protein
MRCGDAWAPCGRGDKRRVSEREKKKKKNHYETSFATVFLVIFTTHCVCVFCGAVLELKEEEETETKREIER